MLNHFRSTGGLLKWKKKNVAKTATPLLFLNGRRSDCGEGRRYVHYSVIIFGVTEHAFAVQMDMDTYHHYLSFFCYHFR